LRFDYENGIQLELLECFELGEKQPGSPWPYQESLLGVSRERGRITLLNCHCTRTALRMRATKLSFEALGYHAGLLVIGEHLPIESGIQYGSIIANCHNLEAFIGLNGLSRTVTEDGQILSYVHPAPITFSFSSFEVTADYMFKADSEPFRNELRQHGELTIFAEGGCTLDEFRRGPLTAFMYLHRLSVGHRVPFLSLEGRSDRHTRTFNGTAYQERMRIFFTQPRALPLPSPKRPFEMMFTLADFGTECSIYMGHWYDAFKRLRNVFDLYFSLDPAGDSDIATEHHFLSAILALEGYHRSAGYGQQDLPDDKHRELVIKAKDAVAPEYREWLDNRLGHNEKTLRSRISELYGEQPKKVQEVLGGQKNFASQIVNTRHSLAHTLSGKKGSISGGLPLFLAIKQLRLILQACFLRQMGLPDSLLAGCLDKSPEYQALRFYKVGDS
jgi:hypothetical protein